MRPRLSDDDEPVGLPASDGDVDGERTPLEGEEDFGLPSGEAEDVGLDAEAGIDDPLESDLALGGQDESGLLKDSEAAGDLGDGDDGDEVGGGDEYGWTDESEPTDDHGLYEGAVSFDDADAKSDDFGEEGFNDDDLASELAGFTLPPLARDDDGPTEDGASGDAREGDAARTRATLHADASRCVALPESRVRCELLQRSGRPLHALIAIGAAGVAWDGSLLVAMPDEERPTRRFADAEVLRALAATVTPSGVEIALSTPGALLRSADWGRTFSRMLGWPAAQGPSSLALARRPDGGIRMLAAEPEGPLLASDDGRSFFALDATCSVLRLASDHGASVVALYRGARNAPELRVSRDGGLTFESVVAPVPEPERVQDLQVAGPSLLVCRRGTEPSLVLAESALDEGFHDVLRELSASAPARVLDERGGPSVYACVSSSTGTSIVRRSSTARAPETVLELPTDVGVALQLAGSHVDGITTLHVGTERAWLRITVLPEGGDA